ncbi:hypothetical protein [Streptomyces sp. CMB-StM0423]|uniref:hypothetical protein n=1 Tax=Streptomyces sp. CMB-StM0423 TaxID=2059884 RepID=UPI00131C9E1E|nr:hypothetical protein [Streptomyces sp. CMB-StM0423]
MTSGSPPRRAAQRQAGRVLSACVLASSLVGMDSLMTTVALHAIAAALVTGAVSLAAFLLWERRVRNPLLPPALFRIRAFAASARSPTATAAGRSSPAARCSPGSACSCCCARTPGPRCGPSCSRPSSCTGWALAMLVAPLTSGAKSAAPADRPGSPPASATP